jgi:hypothetical protein
MLAFLGRRLFDLGCDEFYKTRRNEVLFLAAKTKIECWQNPETFPSFSKKSDKINVDRIRIGVAKYVVATTIFVQNSRREKKNFVQEDD